jgi:hypothetical protein
MADCIPLCSAAAAAAFRLCNGNIATSACFGEGVVEVLLVKAKKSYVVAASCLAVVAFDGEM